MTTQNYQNKWVNLVATYTGSKTNAGFAIYANGIRVDSTNYSAGSYPGQINTTAPVEIGAFAGASYFLKGSLDDVRIYSRALSAHEIQQLYNMGR
jgi:hypothetical protein